MLVSISDPAIHSLGVPWQVTKLASATVSSSVQRVTLVPITESLYENGVKHISKMLGTVPSPYHSYLVS